MSSKYIFPITKKFDYFDADNFRTKKLEGTVELKKAGLPGADAYLISPKLYIVWKKDGKFPKGLKVELAPAVKVLIKKYLRITVRTCFRFSGYENPRSLPAFRDLTSVKEVLVGITNAYKAGEDFAKDNGIGWFDLGLILMGRVEGERSGIILVDPEKSNLSVVECCWGDVHLIATGEDDFDSFLVDSKGKIVHKAVRDKNKGYYFEKGERVTREIEKSKVKVACLSDAEAKKLAKESFKAARYHKGSVEIEYMIRDDGFVDMYELQERPGLHLEIPKEKKGSDSSLVSGVVAHGGKVEGKVKVVKNLGEINQVSPGEVLVLPSKMMGEDIPVIGKVSALVTDTGGITAHISTIAQECGIPCIVGTGDASKKLKDGMRVIVDATMGKVYAYSDRSVEKLGASDEVVWLEGLKAKLNLVGAKAANLINLLQLKMSVPDACVITTEAFEKFLKENKIGKKIEKELSEIDTEELGDVSEKIQKEILKGKIDKGLESKILASFKTLKSKYGSVSVRSSATCEDSVKASFAGQFQSFLFVDDKDTLLESIQRCWASLFRAGAMLYSIKHGIDVKKVKMAVIIQGMIKADMAGVMFTKDLNGKKDTILIEAAEGIGESVVSGEVTPVSYTASKESGRILDKEGSEDLLKASQVSKLVSLGKRIEEALGLAQDIEWAIEKGKIYILQSRPITT